MVLPGKGSAIAFLAVYIILFFVVVMKKITGNFLSTYYYMIRTKCITRVGPILWHKLINIFVCVLLNVKL